MLHHSLRTVSCTLAALSAAGVGVVCEAAEPVVHDPVMIESDGTLYLFGTGRGLTVQASEDGETWRPLPRVFDEVPGWIGSVVPEFGGDLWAPDIIEHDGVFYLYYSASAFGRNTSGIGVATSRSLDPDSDEFGWEDRGLVVRSVGGRDMWNAIDPHIFIDDDGTPWMSFGSHWGGIKLVRLDETLTGIAEPQVWRTIASRHRYWKLDELDAGDAANPNLDYEKKYPAQIQDAALASENGSIEAPVILKKGNWYYQFVSWDRCCRGAESTYKVVVGRAESVMGPYLDRAGQELMYGGGTLVTLGFTDESRFAAGGHCDVFAMDGADYIALHAYDREDGGKPKLIFEPLVWDRHGWPTVDVGD